MTVQELAELETWMVYAVKEEIIETFGSIVIVNCAGGGSAISLSRDKERCVAATTTTTPPPPPFFSTPRVM